MKNSVLHKEGVDKEGRLYTQILIIWALFLGGVVILVRLWSEQNHIFFANLEQSGAEPAFIAHLNRTLSFSNPIGCNPQTRPLVEIRGSEAYVHLLTVDRSCRVTYQKKLMNSPGEFFEN